MTPIKVRGKKQTAVPKPDANPSSSRQPKGKRWLPPTSISPARKWYRAAGSRRLVAKGSDRILSSLEQLPTEILESIFFECLNLNLPQASPTLHHKLTSDHVKTLLVWRAFGRMNPKGASYDLSTILPTVQEQAELQTAILQAKWMTRAFFATLIPKYVVKTLIRELGLRNVKWMGSGPVVSKQVEPTIQQYIKDNMWRADMAGGMGLPAYWEMEMSTGTVDERIYIGIGLHDGLVTIWGPYDFGNNKEVRTRTTPYHNMGDDPWSKWRLLNCVDGCRIPEKLLRGPWSIEKCEFLEIVIRGNASIDWVKTTSGEVAKEGLLEAIRTDDWEAVEALVERTEGNTAESQEKYYFDDELAEFEYYDDEVSDSDEPKISKYRDLPVRKGVGVPVTNEHMRMAVLEQGCKDFLVGALLGSLPKDRYVLDDEIHDWVVVNASKRNKDALWLLRNEIYQQQLDLKEA